MSNAQALLAQFVSESFECLEAIGKRLMDVERDPTNPVLLNDLFRSVHTLKGNCGLFEFAALERVVHAAEDVLDRVRHNELAYGPALADALLDAMDHAGRLVEGIAASGEVDPAADAPSRALAAQLRALLGEADTATPANTQPAATEVPPAEWLARLDTLDAPVRESLAGMVALRYLPEPECFFKGEDPWRLVATTPGLRHLDVGAAHPWPDEAALADWDCYRCNLDIVLVSDADRATLDQHFRYVPEQVQACVLPAASDPEALLDAARRLWAQQAELLQAAGAEAGVVESARRVLHGLLSAAPAGCPDNAPAAAAELDQVTRPGELPGWLAAHTSLPAAGPALPGATAIGAVSGSPAAEPTAGDHGTRTLKVGQEKVDRLMDLIGEMVVAKNALPYLAQRAELQFGQRELAREIKAQYAVINRIAEDMQRAIMEVRMLPVGVVFQRFGRLVRDISRKLGKEVRLIVEGEETEADKNVIEALADPLIHILRNSLDHGVELPARRVAAGKPAQATIRIEARQEGDRVLIEIRDDGAGVDTTRVRHKAIERGLLTEDRAAAMSDDEAVQLVFLPGFSTAETISDLSGRGVGMDVVRTAVERIGGQVVLESKAGEGTAVRLSLPLSMAVSHVMIVESAGRRFGLPMDLIVETVRVHADDIHRFKQARTTVLRDRVVPLRGLNDLLAIDAPELANADGELAVLVVRLAGANVGLVVDHFHGATDIILKPLEGVLAGLRGFSGTALMGDGSVLMVLNPKELL